MGQLLHQLATTISSAISHLAQIDVPSPDTFDDEGVYFQNDFLPRIYDALGDERRLVLLFDEFDVLDPGSGKEATSNSSASSSYQYLGRLVETETRLNFVFVVGQKIEDLSSAANRTIRTAKHHLISMLEGENAKALILMAQDKDLLRFEPQTIDGILQYTSGHPFLTQLMCQLLFDRAYLAFSGPQCPVVVPGDVDKIIPAVLEAGHAALGWLWNSLPPAERVILSAVAEGADGGEAIDEDGIFKLLESHGLSTVTYGELYQAPKRLQDWNILKKVEKGYTCFVRLIQIWTNENKPLDQIKMEMDRLDPAADTHYKYGEELYRHQDLDGAINSLKEALKKNARHLQGRLLLARILRQTGSLPEAIKEYEQAYRQDPMGHGRYELIGSLQGFAEELDGAGKEDEALAQVDRILEIMADDRNALALRNEIWKRRGKNAQEKGQLEEALAAFQKAEALNEVREVEELIRRKKCDALTSEGEAYEAEGDWEKALAIYKQLREMDPANDKAWKEAENRVQQATWLKERDALADKGAACEKEEKWTDAAVFYGKLLEMDPDNQQWVDAKRRVQDQYQLLRLYWDGLDALKELDWLKAQRTLADLVYKQPDYKDAASLLVTAIEKSRHTGTPDAENKQERKQIRSNNVPVMSTLQRLGRGWVNGVTWSPDGTFWQLPPAAAFTSISIPPI